MVLFYLLASFIRETSVSISPGSRGQQKTVQYCSRLGIGMVRTRDLQLGKSRTMISLIHQISYYSS